MKSTFRLISHNFDNVTILVGSISDTEDEEIAKVTAFYDIKRHSARIYTKTVGSNRNNVKKLENISFDTLTNILYSELDMILV